MPNIARESAGECKRARKSFEPAKDGIEACDHIKHWYTAIRTS